MSRVRLWCDNARGKCQENMKEACKTRGVAECFTRFFPPLISQPSVLHAFTTASY